MTNIQTNLQWEPIALEKYNLMLKKMPVFHRQLAQEVVNRKALENALSRGAKQVEESDIVHAFLTDVPLAFYSLMIRLMDDVKFDYRKYEKNN